MNITEAVVISILIICLTIIGLTAVVMKYDKDFLKEDKKKKSTKEK